MITHLGEPFRSSHSSSRTTIILLPLPVFSSLHCVRCNYQAFIWIIFQLYRGGINSHSYFQQINTYTYLDKTSKYIYIDLLKMDVFFVAGWVLSYNRQTSDESAALNGVTESAALGRVCLTVSGSWTKVSLQTSTR